MDIRINLEPDNPFVIRVEADNAILDLAERALALAERAVAVLERLCPPVVLVANKNTAQQPAPTPLPAPIPLPTPTPAPTPVSSAKANDTEWLENYAPVLAQPVETPPPPLPRPAPVPVPVPMPVPASPPPSYVYGRFTEERKRYVLENYTSKMTTTEIFHGINDLPGEFISIREIHDYASILSITARLPPPLPRPAADKTKKKTKPIKLTDSPEKDKTFLACEPPDRTSTGPKWSPERLNTLELYFPTQVPVMTLYDRLNRLSGPKIEVQEISAYATMLGLRRPPIIKAPQKVHPFQLPIERVTWDTLVDYAHTHGLPVKPGITSRKGALLMVNEFRAKNLLPLWGFV